jgi:hypothetical protein
MELKILKLTKKSKLLEQKSEPLFNSFVLIPLPTLNYQFFSLIHTFHQYTT